MLNTFPNFQSTVLNQLNAAENEHYRPRRLVSIKKEHTLQRKQRPHVHNWYTIKFTFNNFKTTGCH